MNKKRKKLASIIIFISTFWVWYYGQMVYDEVFVNSLIAYCFRPPLFVSVINSLIAVSGILIGIKVFQNHLKLRTAFFSALILIILAFIFDNFGYHLL